MRYKETICITKGGIKLYFLFNKSLNMFYGKGAVWVQKGAVKANLHILCVFGDMYEAKECLKQEKFGHSTTILNEKSLKNRLGIKCIPEDLQSNWQDHYSFSAIQKDRETKKKDAETETGEAISGEDNENEDGHKQDLGLIIDEDKKMTYIEYLEQLESARIISSGNRTYIQSEPWAMSNTRLIQATIDYLNKTKELLQMWAERMKSIEFDIRNYDLQISDELHILEICSELSDEDMLESAKRIQAIRRKRRIAKNEQEIGKIFLPTLQTGVNMEKVENLEHCISTQKEKVYRVRQPKVVVQMTEKDRALFSSTLIHV